MKRVILCDLCEEEIQEDELFVHLVKVHGWHAVKHAVPADHVSVAPRPQPAIAKPSSPRLGPHQPSISSAEYLPTVCPYCGKHVEAKLLGAHLQECSARRAKMKRKSAGSAEEEIKCPICATTVFKKNLRRHVKKSHPDQLAQFDKTPDTLSRRVADKPLPAKKTKQCPYCHQDISEKRYLTHTKQRCPKRPKNLPERSEFTYLDKEIGAIVDRLPSTDTVGPQGTPQAKYRQGTYGLHGMEYDAWGRGK